MSKQRTIVWIGPDRLIPPYGAVNPGDERSDLPPRVAQSFVDQKLAKWKTSSTKKERSK